ncbi:MAG: energy transducer TonB [Pseudoxanthomonas sp.]
MPAHLFAESAMKNWTAIPLFGCLLASAGNGHAAETDKNARKAWLRAGIVLDATGKLASIEWLGTKPNDRLVTAPLEAVIRDWEFEPGKVDGVPAVTETGLLLHVELRKTAEGGIVLNIDDARTGAFSVKQDPPAYPRDQARLGVQARVLMNVQTDATGQVISARMEEYEGSRTGTNSRKDFEAAALNAVKSWTYRTEQVGGNGLAVTLRVPISFCFDAKWCESKEAKDDKVPESASPSGMAMATDSAARIKTRTSQVEI